MCKKLLLFTAAIVLLLAFAGQAMADPNLVGLWEFNGDANDSSGNGNDGTLSGTYGSYTSGKIAEALLLEPNDACDLDPGNASVAVPNDVTLNFSDGSFTIAVWLKYATTSNGTILTKGLDTFTSGYRYRWSGSATFIDVADGTTVKTTGAGGSGDIDDGEWHHHVAFRNCVKDGTPTTGIYFDSTLNGVWFAGVGSIDTSNELVIGRNGEDSTSGYFSGLIDDLRLYNKYMTQADIFELMEPFAWDPSPENGELYVPLDADLSWNPGMSSARFDVYFGTDASDVNDANTTITLGVYKSNQDVNSYDPGTLAADTTYYWRIDSLDDSNSLLNKGDVWSFDSLPSKAHDPDPKDEEAYVLLEKVLSWSAGNGVSTHDVYFGTDSADVNDANTTSGLGVYKGNQGGTTFDPNDPTASDLLINTTYYWRIDEVNSTTVKGDVWEFTTIVSIDANLVHWKFDEGQGTDAYDASGNGNTGTLNGDTAWIASALGGALEFDGDADFVRVQHANSLNFGAEEFTISMWVKPGSSSNGMFLAKGTSGGEFTGASGKRYQLEQKAAGGGLRITIDDNINKTDLYTGDLGLRDGGWHLVMGLRDNSAGRLRLYADGTEVASMGNNTATSIDANELLEIAKSPYHTGYYTGQIDDVRLYHYALSQDEIDELASKAAFPPAWDPMPRDGSANVRQNTELDWKKGVWAQSHDVYFGTNWGDVNDANTTVDPNKVYKGNVFATSWDPATDPNYSSGLDKTKTYYWRIDEVNVASSNYEKGDVWSFTTADMIIVDDMELYGNSPDPCGIWKDGNNSSGTTGSAVFLQKGDFVHLGVQSMKYNYENSGITLAAQQYGFWPGTYSEIEASTTGTDSLDCGTDWTRDTSKTLTLYFYGDPNNDVNSSEQMYVVIADGDGSDANAIIKYGDYNTNEEDANDLKDESWHEWNIALDDFNTPTDVNLANIDKVYIGFGVRGALDIMSGGVAGGNGTVYFDDIRLNQSRCVAIYNSDVDLNGDCDIDYNDIAVLQNDWLDVNTVAVNPDANLVAHYEFEDDVNDSVGGTPDQNGVKYGDSAYTTGKIGSKAISFDPTDANDYVIVDDANGTIAAEFSTESFSVAMWIKSSEDAQNGIVLCNGTDGGNWGTGLQSGNRYETRFGNPYFFFDIDDNSTKSQALVISTLVATGEWVHVAGVRNTADSTINLYIDGVLGASEIDSSGDISSPDEPLVMGAKPEDVNNISGEYTCAEFYTGELDDARIYNKALTVGEVIYLATEGGPTPDSMKYDTDLNLDNFVDLKDYAILADAWLDDYRWP